MKTLFTSKISKNSATPYSKGGAEFYSYLSVKNGIIS